MRKIAAVFCALLMLLAALPAVAEDAMPPEVQAFFDAMGDAVQPEQVVHAADHESYIAGMPANFLTFSLSRMQYDQFYYFVHENGDAVTVCCKDGKPLAYILDFTMMHYVAYVESFHQMLMAFPEAYCAANPQQESAPDAYDLLSDTFLNSVYEDDASPLVSEMQDLGQTLASRHVFTAYSLSAPTSIQLFPKAAYDGVTYEDQPLTAEGNHELTAMLAVSTEYQLVMKTLE